MQSRALKQIVPLLDRVLVRKVKPLEKTASGIFIPEAAQGSMNRGVVVAVGPGALDKDGKRIPMNVAEGDEVILPEFSGSNIKTEQADEEVFIYRDAELLAKINKA